MWYAAVRANPGGVAAFAVFDFRPLGRTTLFPWSHHMGKGNNSQKNDKKNKKPKQDAKKPDPKSAMKK